jgi:O-antigen/teichoic acid export membrane protein
MTLLQRARAYAGFFRLAPFDASTPDGRSRERHRRVAMTALGSAGARAVSTLAGLITVPLTLHYLGSERYGMWMTISAVVSFLTFADLGMGSGLLNGISEANGRDDRALAREVVSSAFFMLCGVAGLTALLFGALYPWVPWAGLFNISSSQASSEAGPALLVLVACFLVNIPLGVVQRVQQGYQEGFANSLWVALGSVFSLVAVLVAVHLEAPLAWLVLAMVGTPILAVVLNGTDLFARQRPWLTPSRKAFRWAAARKILGVGLLFLAMQVGVTVAFASDNLVAAHALGPSAVAELSVAARLFGLVPMVLAMVLAPLWPAYRESLTRGDTAWVKRTLRASLGLALLVSGSSAILLTVFGKAIIRAWVGGAVAPGLPLLAGLGAWTVLFGVGSAYAMFLNAANEIRFQVATWALIAVGGVAAKVLLCKPFGLAGIVWASASAYLIFSLIPMVLFVPRVLARGSGHVAAENKENGP